MYTFTKISHIIDIQKDIPNNIFLRHSQKYINLRKYPNKGEKNLSPDNGLFI